MSSSSCPNCGKILQRSDYIMNGLAIQCNDCGYSGAPLKPENSYLQKLKDKEPRSDFEIDMNLDSIFSKMAIVSFFAFAVSLTSVELKGFTIISFVGFLLFSVFCLFIRSRS